MDVQGGKFQRVRELVRELDLLDEILNVSSNSDSKAKVIFSTENNQEHKKRKVISIDLPPEERAQIIKYVLKRQREIIAELEQL